MSLPTAYRPKPVVIEAVRLEDWWRHHEIINWIESHGGRASLDCNGTYDCNGHGHQLRIHTRRGVVHATLGDYVVKDGLGKFDACTSDVFEATYEQEEKDRS